MWSEIRARHRIIECLYVHFLDGVYTFTKQSDFHKIKLRGANFDSPQQLIPTDLACMTSRIVISILKLTRKYWSSLVPKMMTQPHLWLYHYSHCCGYNDLKWRKKERVAILNCVDQNCWWT